MMERSVEFGSLAIPGVGSQNNCTTAPPARTLSAQFRQKSGELVWVAKLPTIAERAPSADSVACRAESLGLPSPNTIGEAAAVMGAAGSAARPAASAVPPTAGSGVRTTATSRTAALEERMSRYRHGPVEP